MYKIHKNDLDIRMKKIVFLNATFEDNAHEIIDTSIIYCASNIFEEVKVRFLNDRSQIIEKEIADNFSCDNIYFRPFHNIKKKVNGFSGLGNNIVSRTINKLRIVLREIISFMQELLEYISYKNRNSIFCLTYINRYNCYVLNFACKVFKRPLYIFCHSEIEDIVLKKDEIKSNYVRLQYKFLTEAKIAKNARLVVLGDSIWENVSKYLDKERLKYFLSVDHPYYNTYKGTNMASINNKKNINIGVIGNLTHSNNRGFYNVLALANKLKDVSKITVNILGKVDKASFEKLDGLVNFYNKSGLLIPREDYDKNISDMDYIYIPYPVDSFKFTASGSLLEAICKLKPVLYHRNCYASYIISKFGDFGIDVDAHNTKELVNLLTDSENYSVLLRKQKTVADKIHPHSLIDQYIKLFNQI